MPSVRAMHEFGEVVEHFRHLVQIEGECVAVQQVLLGTPGDALVQAPIDIDPQEIARLQCELDRLMKELPAAAHRAIEATRGRLEPEVFRRLSGEPDRLVALYVTVLGAARAVGLGEDRVPELLADLAVGAGLPLLGQEELGPRELEVALDGQRGDVAAMAAAWDMPERDTVRIAEARVRLGQHRFARAVLLNYGLRCAFCGFAPRHLAGHRLVVASHVKPWRESSDRERLDPRNGVAACPVHDAAFDAGLLAVNGGLAVHRAPSLMDSLAADEGTDRYFAEPVLRARLLLPDGAVPPDPRYLAWHREHVFRAA